MNSVASALPLFLASALLVAACSGAPKIGDSLMCDGASRVILDCSADQARHRWRDESRGRALFEREDRGEMGPRILDRSFEGTYR